MVKELIIKNRSVRRYDNEKKLSAETLSELVDAARLCASAGNRQRIRYATVTEADNLKKMRAALGFAAYLKDWGGPSENENPTGYVVMLTEDDDVNLFVDMGIAASSMLLLAAEMDIGGCIFRSFDPQNVKNIIGSEGYTPRLVISLGVPAERVELTDAVGGDIRYYRENDIHKVPKLSLEEVLIAEK